MRRPAPHPPLLRGKHEDDPLGGLGTLDLRPCDRAGREGRPGRDVELQVRDRRHEADVHTDNQEGWGQVRRDDELAGPEGDETQGRETEGRRSDLLRQRVVMENNYSVEYKLTINGDKLKGKGAVEVGGEKREFDIEGKREKKDE